MDMAFMEFIKNNKPNPFQSRIRLQPAGKDSLGDNLYLSLWANAFFHADLVSNTVTRSFPEKFSHMGGTGPCRQPPGLQHNDFFIFQPGAVHQA